MKVKLCERCGAEIYKFTHSTKYCIDCKSDVINENRLNHYHRHKEDVRIKSKARYNQRKLENKCPKCGLIKQVENNKVYCESCAEKIRISKKMHKLKLD